MLDKGIGQCPSWPKLKWSEWRERKDIWHSIDCEWVTPAFCIGPFVACRPKGGHGWGTQHRRKAIGAFCFAQISMVGIISKITDYRLYWRDPEMLKFPQKSKLFDHWILNINNWEFFCVKITCVTHATLVHLSMDVGYTWPDPHTGFFWKGIRWGKGEISYVWRCAL